MGNSKLFTPVTFGPLTLRNRTIRSAAFESMCPGNAPRICCSTIMLGRGGRYRYDHRGLCRRYPERPFF